jgi:hypothetical protein
MSDGRAQFTRLRATDAAGAFVASAKLYHYEAGTATLKNIWQDEDKTTPLAQPFISDSTGYFNFYADGRYKTVIKDTADVTLHTLDDWEITGDQSLIFETSHGTSLPSATNAKKFMMFAKHGATEILDSVHILHGVDGATEWAKLWGVNIRNVEFYGAVGDGSTDDTTAIQDAIDAASSGQVVYLPANTYKITAALTISDKTISFVGDGIGSTIIKQATTSVGTIDFDSTSVNKLSITNMSIETTANGAGSAISADWDTGIPANNPYLYINNVSIGPSVGSEATAKYDIGIVLTDCVNGIIANVNTRGKTGDHANGTGIQIQGGSSNVRVINCGIHIYDKGVSILDTTTRCIVANCVMTELNNGILVNITSTGEGMLLLGNSIISYTRGIYTDATAISFCVLEGNTMEKHTSSTANYIGILGGFKNSVIDGNIIQGGGTSGTEIGIQMTATSTNDVHITNNLIDTQEKGILFDTDADDCVVSNNRIDNSTDVGITVVGNRHKVSNNNIQTTAEAINVGTSTNSSITGNIGVNCTYVVDLTANSTSCFVANNYGVNLGTAVTRNQGTTNIVARNYPHSGTMDTFTDADATPDVSNSSGGVGAFLANNSGATTITNFDGGYEGQSIIIIATNSNTTIQDNANIELATPGVDFVMATNDSITLINVGVWRETARAT